MLVQGAEEQQAGKASPDFTTIGSEPGTESKGWERRSNGGYLPAVGITFDGNHDSLRSVEFQEIGTQ